MLHGEKGQPHLQLHRLLYSVAAVRLYTFATVQVLAIQATCSSVGCCTVWLLSSCTSLLLVRMLVIKLDSRDKHHLLVAAHTASIARLHPAAVGLLHCFVPDIVFLCL